MDRAVYGPYWRRQSRTQTLRAAAGQVVSGELHGTVPRPGWGPLEPCAKAFPGELPADEKGIEFYASVPPDVRWPSYWAWTTRQPEVWVVSEDWVGVEVVVTEVRQSDPALIAEIERPGGGRSEHGE